MGIINQNSQVQVDQSLALDNGNQIFNSGIMEEQAVVDAGQAEEDAGPVEVKPHDELQRIRDIQKNEKTQILREHGEVEEEIYKKFEMPAVFQFNFDREGLKKPWLEPGAN